ncbi:hypothetical protein [Rhodococcus gannanensis]|uniref:Uncharacterized protein n=1 Tax=Rhodococcus gannanensis TaxID=1960308 RepID=A0ABW4P1Y6_9NOCA
MGSGKDSAESDKASAAGKGPGKQSGGSGKAEATPLAVGDTVVTKVDPATGEGEQTDGSGVIVDDFGDNLAADDADYGRSWALAKRWAIKLDDGRLVFRSSDEVSRSG